MANGQRILSQATVERDRLRLAGQFVLTLPPPPLRLQPLEFGHCTAVSADRGKTKQMKILTASQMREVDRLTTERYGIPSLLLMENAGSGVVRALESHFPD